MQGLQSLFRELKDSRKTSSTMQATKRRAGIICFGQEKLDSLVFVACN